MGEAQTEGREVFLISNPNAGRGGARREREVELFRARLASHGLRVEVASTQGPRDASRLAREASARGFREVIVSGGDGTIHEAVQGLVGAKARVGIWPAGTSNVLARHLALPFDAERAAQVFAEGRTRRITLGRATDAKRGDARYFFLIAGVGLDASVVRHTRPRLKRRVGEAAYWYAGLGHLAHWQPRVFTVEVDGEEHRATYAAVGKAPWYGGGLAVTPRARLDADHFEVCVINTQSRLRYLYLLTHAMRDGLKGDRKDVRFIKARSVRISGESDVQADGELIGRLPMTFELVPEGLEVVVP
ncbi:MAG TPA: diacylglycerol kinase family protein [Pyrinomonadaceae bacterium]|nr:diacylglycerol kinase family protein [Pyrinomonadaceae bacterium]